MTQRDVSAATTSAARSGRVSSIFLRGPSGQLEALWNEGSVAARSTALVCHPHPLGGGSLHNKVVYHAMKVCNAPAWGFALPTLRFNFRGAGLSEGEHDGLAESEDVLAALDWLSAERGLPIVLIGFSFGAAMALKAAYEDPHADRIAALALLGLPVSDRFPELQRPEWLAFQQPKLFLSGARDEFAPLPQLQKTVEHAATHGRLATIAGADHFFTGRIKEMQAVLGGWLKEHLP